jgi:hypothetical protein
MKTAVFRRGGAALRAGVTCRPKRDGRYTITLWESGVNEVVPPSPWSGNFVNADDDEFALPTPVGRNDGRLLECLVTVSVPPDVRPSRITFSVSQAGKVLGEVHQDVPPDSPAGQALLFIALAAG